MSQEIIDDIREKIMQMIKIDVCEDGITVSLGDTEIATFEASESWEILAKKREY